MAGIINKQRKNLGISISEPTDMNLWGITPSHIKDAMIEVGRHAVNYGYNLSYGGDLQYGGFINFSELLMEIVLRYGDYDIEDESSEKYVTNYLASYLAEKADEQVINSFAKLINVVKAPSPKKLISITTDRESVVYKSLSLSSMRIFMNEEIDARILIGGKYLGFQGLLPGVLEEAYLAVKSNKPLYLIGGFGGCTRKIIELLKGETPVELTLNYQLEHDKSKSEFVTALKSLIIIIFLLMKMSFFFLIQERS